METTTFGFLGSSANMLFGVGWLCAIFVIYLIITYNSLISAKNSTSESFSAIDTILQNRYDLIPNLVEVVKQYASHESGIMSKVTEMRSALMSQSDKGSTKRFTEENALQWTMKSLFAVAENYPDLKASTNFLELQTQWSEIEDRMQWARRAYNAAVKNLNDKKEMFPSNIIAGMMHLPEFSMYEADEVARTTRMDAKALFNS